MGGLVQEARCIRSRQNVSNGVVPLAALAGSRCDREVQQWIEREAKVCIGDQKSPHAGAGRQPSDREVQRAAHAAPEEAPQKVSWGG